MSDVEAEAGAEPTNVQATAIKPINAQTVHQICSDQVVLSLAVAVKELVENGIDSGATLVEVKLRNQGLESLEVCDNGSGVEEHNLHGMTAKYHTSKIREFVDLQGVETFGFRGEALSSLCSLADMTIVTRHKSTEVGIKIELDYEGKITKRSPCARSVGTTVRLENLFATRPVRRRDFTRNIKKEFTKMCQILQAYCLVSKGVRIICTNYSAKGVKSVVMQTHGDDVLANISAIFGSRQSTDIVPLKAAFDTDDLTAEVLMADLQSDAGDSIRITDDDVERLKSGQFKLEGYVSSCSHGSGRSSRDRQYFYINSRPCDPKSIAKVFNDVYHRYNVQQFPFVYLNVITPRAEVDVNLTPDKRQLLINNEKILLLAIKKALLNTFCNIPSTYKIQNSIMSMLGGETKATDAHNMETNSEEIESPAVVPTSSKQNFIDVLSQWKYTGDTVGQAPHVAAKRKCTEELAERTLKMKKMQEYLTREDEDPNEKLNNTVDLSADLQGEDNNNETGNEDSINMSVINVDKLNKQSADYDALILNKSRNSPAPITIERIDCKVVTPAKPRLSFVEVKPQESNEETFFASHDQPISLDKIVELDEESPISRDFMSSNCVSEIRTSLNEIELNVNAEECILRERRCKVKLDRLRFKSEISPSQNENAEKELQKEISKAEFARMEILGQFNLGFIIVKLDTDLLIVDQHASDEKYNFEMLQRTTVLQNQTLALPQALEMTAVNEMLLLDNLEVFQKNGFKFEINENAPPTKKVRLLAKPFSKNWEFGKEDIDELLFMLQDAPEGTICRPSRIRDMFASRACRKSVMIGKALNRTTMKMLVRHMGEIEQPWNCPHGRPTMRYLINTAMLFDEDDKSDQMGE